MAILVVGGQASKVGKTTVVTSILRALPQLHWTAFKITPHAHGLRDLPFSITEEQDPTAATDTSRYLAAGAVRAFWVRTQEGRLDTALPNLRNELARATNALIESNSILDFLEPELSVMMLNPAIKDFKDSANRFLDRADAVLWMEYRDQAHEPAGWLPHAETVAKRKRQFVLGLDGEMCAEFLQWISGGVSARP